MKRFVVCGLLPVSLSVLVFVCGAGARGRADVLKQRERSTVSLELELTKKNANGLQRLVSLLTGVNAYATGFFVGDRLVLTAYHAVSGELDSSKKLALGFGRDDELEARAFVGGCQARILGVDKDADLALLEICSARQTETPTFQLNVSKDEKLLLIARPRGDKIISYGTFSGAYNFRGLEYWSAKLSARDGFSGSPVYNEHGELVGVFSGYDWSQKLAVISPGDRAQKLVAQYAGTSGP